MNQFLNPAFLAIGAVGLGAFASQDAVAQSTTRITALRNAPITSIALPGTSASVSVNSGHRIPGRRQVLVTRPQLAMPGPFTKTHISIASN